MEDYLLTLALDTVQITNARRDTPYTVSEYRTIASSVRKIRNLLDQINRSGIPLSNLAGETTNSTDASDKVDKLLATLEMPSQEIVPLTTTSEETSEESTSTTSMQPTLFGDAGRSAVDERTGRQNIGDSTPRTRTWHHELRRELEKLAEFDIQDTDFLSPEDADASDTLKSEKLFSVQSESGEMYHAEDISSLVKYLFEIEHRGLTITRYKGLAEMNAEQLRDTTMRPDERILLRVTLEDAVEADRIFTLLMGDTVEPRREFIERYGTQVNLDLYGA